MATIDNLYDFLSKNAKGTPDRATFDKAMQSKSNRDALHRILSQRYSGVPDIDAFDKALGNRDMTFTENAGRVAGEIWQTVLDVPKLVEQGWRQGQIDTELSRSNIDAERVASLTDQQKAIKPTVTQRRGQIPTDSIIPGGFIENPVSWLAETVITSTTTMLPQVLERAPQNVSAGMLTGSVIGASMAGTPTLGVGAAPGAVAGAITGAAAAVPITISQASSVQAHSELLLSTLREKYNVDINDHDALVKALSDTKLINKIKSDTALAAETQGFFDGIAATFSGGIAKSATKKFGNKVLGKVVGETGEFVAQSASGMAGEAGKQIITSGKITDAQAVTAEGLAEAPAAGIAARIGKAAIRKGGEALKFTLNTGSAAHFNNLNPDFKSRLEGMAEEYKQQTGKDLQVNSAARSEAEQQTIYGSGVRPAAKPGKSGHNRGEAVGIGKQNVADLVDSGLLEKYGFETGEAFGDPNHIQNAGKTVDQQALDMLPDDMRVKYEETAAVVAPEPVPVVEQTRDRHKQIILKRLSEGVSVSPEILLNFPDIVSDHPELIVSLHDYLMGKGNEINSEEAFNFLDSVPEGTVFQSDPSSRLVLRKKNTLKSGTQEYELVPDWLNPETGNWEENASALRIVRKRGDGVFTGELTTDFFPSTYTHISTGEVGVDNVKITLPGNPEQVQQTVIGDAPKIEINQPQSEVVQQVAEKISKAEPLTIEEQQVLANETPKIEAALQQIKERKNIAPLQPQEAQVDTLPQQPTSEPVIQAQSVTAAPEVPVSLPEPAPVEAKNATTQGGLKFFWAKTRKEIADTTIPEYSQGLLDIHEEKVKQALLEGKPVPAEVLADYPELAKSVEPAPQGESITEEMGRAGAATYSETESGGGELWGEWKDRAYLARVMDDVGVSEETRRKIGQDGSLYYREISHVQTTAEAEAFVKGKDAFVISAIIQDVTAPISERMRIYIGKITAKRLDSMAKFFRTKGDESLAVTADNMATELYRFVGTKLTDLGQAIEIVKDFDPYGPETTIGSYVRAVDKVRKPKEGIITPIIDELNNENNKAITPVIKSKKIKEKVSDAIKKKSSKVGQVKKGESERGIWERYVQQISEAMDVTGGTEKQVGALQEFAGTVKKTFLSKIGKPEVEGKPKRSAISIVRDQIANSKEMFDSWKTARELAINGSSNPEALSALIPNELDAPFSVSDIRKVMREHGAFDLDKIARTWGEGREALTSVLVESLMQNQPIGVDEFKKVERSLRKMIGEIVDTEKSRMERVQRDIAAVKERRRAEKSVVRPASVGGSLGEQVKDKAASALASKLGSRYKLSVEQTPLNVFVRNLVSSLSEKFPDKDKSTTEKDYTGMIKDAILNRNQYVDVWERARAVAIDRFPSEKTEIDKIFNELDSVIPDNAIRSVIQKELADAEVTLETIVRQHYKKVGTTGELLSKKIAEGLGITDAEAIDLAEVINDEFKRLVAKKKGAIIDRLSKKSVAIRRATKGKIDKIIELSNVGALDAPALFDLLADELGIPKVNNEILGNLKQLANIQEEAAGLRNEYGFSKEFWVAKKNLEDYYMSLMPAPIMGVITGTIGRGNMVAGLKSSITNVIGNSVISITETLNRRIVDNAWNGLNGAFAKEYFRYVQEVYDASGYDPTRMVSIKDSQKRLGEEIVHAKGPGKTRAYGRFVEDFIFKKLLGKPDVMFSAAHFVDSANCNSTKIARNEKLKGADQKARALEIFKDAVQIEPKTKEGLMVRDRAIADATRATYTDETIASKIALSIRKALNHTDIKYGDLNIPFAKTPANVVYRTLEASGILAPYDVYELYKGMVNNDEKLVRKSLKGLVSAGLGLTGAFLLASALKPDDYMDEYFMASKAERAMLRSIGGTYAAIRIGKNWISMDYFGALAAPLIGLLAVKKYGGEKGLLEKASMFYSSVGTQITRIPGMNEIYNIIEGIKDSSKGVKSKGFDIKEKALEAAGGLIDFISPRVMPSIISDIAKALDPFERQTKSGTVGGVVQGVQKNIPLLRNQLPEKTSMFGEPIESQPWWSVLMFGARYKQGKDTQAYNELQRLNSASELPSVTDIATSSVRVKKLKEQIGESNFKRAVGSFGIRFKDNVDKMLDSQEYAAEDDEGKKGLWNEAKADALKYMLKEYGYVQERKRSAHSKTIPKPPR